MHKQGKNEDYQRLACDGPLELARAREGGQVRECERRVQKRDDGGRRLVVREIHPRPDRIRGHHGEREQHQQSFLPAHLGRIGGITSDGEDPVDEAGGCGHSEVSSYPGAAKSTAANAPSAIPASCRELTPSRSTMMPRSPPSAGL